MGPRYDEGYINTTGIPATQNDNTENVRIASRNGSQYFQGQIGDLRIYNRLGQKVATLISELQSVGTYKVEWDASKFASGVYYYQLKSGEFQAVKKIILVK